jgi:hypothetical protein
MLYRICWITSTGYSGHGEYCLTRELAEKLLIKLSVQYPEINHWIECDEVAG